MPLSRNLGTLTSWNPLGLIRPVMGLLYIFLLLLLLILTIIIIIPPPPTTTTTTIQNFLAQGLVNSEREKNNNFFTAVSLLTRLRINVFRYFISPFPRRCTADDTDPLQISFSHVGTLTHTRALQFPTSLLIQHIAHWNAVAQVSGRRTR